jgi:tetratricopeptide (TPR) repeat protein
VIARQYSGIREWDEAQTYVEKFLRSSPSNSWEGHKALGDIFRETNRLDDAFEEYKTAAEASPTPHRDVINRSK